jgi:hypothetical protein
MDMNDLMQQAQRMREAMEQQQKDLTRTEFVGRAGGGLVEVTLNGKMAALKVRIDRKMLSDDPEMTEDLIAAAFNDALNRIHEAQGSGMQQMLGGLGLPPGFKMPF